MTLFGMLDRMKRSLRPDPVVRKVRDEVVATINSEISKQGVKALAVPGGSVAKDTFLASDHDIDVFIRFSPDYDDDELSDLAEELLEGFSPERLHGSRDYFQFAHGGYEFEVVPVLDVEHSGQARNVTDMSPIHVEYFLSRGKGLEDEVRLAKQFCKSARVYGAESYISGFSGHVIDLLVLHYGSFYELLKQAARWRPPVVIDMERHHKEPLRAIDRAKHSPLILIDPVQPDRNAAAALSRESFDRFVGRARAFIEEPSEEFFVVESFSLDALRKRLRDSSGAAVLVHVRTAGDDKRDVAGARIRKAFERLQAAFGRSGFSVLESGWHFSAGGSVLWFVTREHSLPRLVEREGPPASQAADAERFRKTHREVTERDGRLYTHAERVIRTPPQVVGSLLKHLEEDVHVSVESVEEIQAA